jgi:DNA repair exonuclease SbcCD nuclease subunit
MKFINLFAAALFAALAGCQSPEPKSTGLESLSYPAREDAPVFRALIVGDWGRMGIEPQKITAQFMTDFAQANPLDFIVSTGDNFYDNGVTSTTDAHWAGSFEDVYADSALFAPWYVVLGNHDYRGSIESQMAYRSPNADRWKMPAKNYVKSWNQDGITMAIVFINTSPTEDKYYGEEQYRRVWREDSAAQKKWFRAVMDTLKADYRIVVGHHPLYSGGKRMGAKTQSHLNHWGPLFAQYRVKTYLCGHEHDLQHIKADLGMGHTLDHVVTGAGSEIRETGEIQAGAYEGDRAKTVFSLSANGFMTLDVHRDAAVATLWSGGQPVHQFTINPDKP